MRLSKNTEKGSYDDFYPQRKHFYYVSPLVKVEQDVQFEQENQSKPTQIINDKKNLLIDKNIKPQAYTELSYCSNSSSLSILRQQKNKRKYLNDFIFVKNIGKGTFGKVEKLKYNYVDIYVAAKVIYKTPRETCQKAKLMKLQNQIQIYKQISHPNFAELISVYQWKRQITLIMELAQGDNLNSVVRQHPNQQIRIAKIMYQIFDALEYLDKLNIVHRDIKAENIIYDQKSEIIKIVDFGQAICVKNQQQKFHLGGTYAYFAPQSFKHEFSHKSDTWACGVLLYYLLSTKLIFLDNGKNRQEIMENILNKKITFQNDYWPKRSDEVKQLILRLLERDVKKRITAYQAKKCLWIQKNIQNWRPPILTNQQKLVRKSQTLTVSILKDLNQSQKRSSSKGHTTYMDKKSNKVKSKFCNNIQNSHP